ncbi:Tlg2-vesicle protein [Tulasnella sp. JGI-2019a]|nr:Tlg2-vesicle protein [Tulasnella sp. JGI-2019a]
MLALNYFKKKRNADSNLSTTSLDYPSYNTEVESSSTYPPMPTSNNPAGGHVVTMEHPGPIRTPSPTPSDIEELRKGAIDWSYLLNWKSWAKKEYIVWYIVGGILIIITVLLAIYHTTIVHWLEPGARYLKNLPGGWSIPIGIMFVLSFPPLFGNEIVHVLCGLVWGLWIGFGIVCAGTFLGEVGNFYAFKYLCTSRGEKLERDKLTYACLARCVREGGFLVALVARLSAIPGHFTTAVFATVGMHIWTFCLGAFLSLPKQFATVYIGVALEQAAGTETRQQRILSAVVITLSIVITIWAARWVLAKMNAAKPAVLAERRKRRAMEIYNLNQSKVYNRPSDLESSTTLTENPFKTPAASTTTISAASFNKPFNYDGSNVNLPLGVQPQRWDRGGRAILDNQPQLPYNNQDPNAYPAPPQQYQPGNQYEPTAIAAPPPPNIRVIRASQASTLTATQAQAQTIVGNLSSSRSPPRRSDSDSTESNGPAWAAGTVMKDDVEARSPLRMTSSPGRNNSDPPLFNPYEGFTSPPPPGTGHRAEPTGASDGSYHTAQGSYGGFENVDYPSGSEYLAQQEMERKQRRP